MSTRNVAHREPRDKAGGIAPLPWINRLLCIAILLLAGAVRFIGLQDIPPEFNVDEALHAYEAYAILKTGHDQWGEPWPITFRAFNDYRRPAAIYTAVPFIAIFDLTVYGIRAMAAFWGWITVILTYRLAADLFGRPVGLAAALVLTLSSWHVGYSRMGVEASGPMLACLVAGLDLGWRWYRSRKPGWLMAAAVAFGLSLYTYTITQALTPLLLGAMGLLFVRPLLSQRRSALVAGLVMVAIAVPLVAAVAGNEVTWNRLDAISVLGSEGGWRLALQQWMGHFSPRYLYLSGDASPIHHIPGYGQLYWIEVLLVPLGLLALVRHRKEPRSGLLLLAWLVLSPIPAALTRQDMGSPNSMRALSGVVPWSILSGLGLAAAGRWRPSLHRVRSAGGAALTGLLLGGLLWNAGLVLYDYFTRYPVEAARAFEYGVGEAMDYVREHEDAYDTIVLTDWISQPHIFAVFYTRYDPGQFQNRHAPYGQRLSEKLTAWGDKYRTGNVEQLYEELDNGLFVARPHMLPEIEPVLVILHPDGSPAFKVIAK